MKLIFYKHFAEAVFDLILMTHPSAVGGLPDDCTAIPPAFDPRTVSGPGRCLYQPLVGIAERDPRYDKFINSQGRGLQCLSSQGQCYSVYKIARDSVTVCIK